MPPYLILGLVLAIIYGTLFHLWRGRTFQDLALYLAVAVVGFGVGHYLGVVFGLSMWLVGPLHLAEGTVVSWASLFVAQWLRLKPAPSPEEKS